ncbi:MAG TPA: class I tRNA ligase family protein, partial [Magnetovibrio sp.]
VLIRACNGYVDRQAPWKLKKEDPARMATVLYVLVECIRHIALLLQPFMPHAMSKMLDLLVVSPAHRSFDFLGSAHVLEPGRALPIPEGIFPRFVEAEQEG